MAASQPFCVGSGRATEGRARARAPSIMCLSPRPGRAGTGTGTGTWTASHAGADAFGGEAGGADGLHACSRADMADAALADGRPATSQPGNVKRGRCGVAMQRLLGGPAAY
jgi:hypothetical protein